MHILQELDLLEVEKLGNQASVWQSKFTNANSDSICVDPLLAAWVCSHIRMVHQSSKKGQAPALST